MTNVNAKQHKQTYKYVVCSQQPAILYRYCSRVSSSPPPVCCLLPLYSFSLSFISFPRSLFSPPLSLLEFSLTFNTQLFRTYRHDNPNKNK